MIVLDSQFTIPVYSGGHDLIISLRTLIETEFRDLFKAVIVHGSIATNEVVNYSDFDGLLIVKDNYRSDPRLGVFLNRSMKIVYDFDPLQHHGWFVITESELNVYPECRLPQIIFESSMLIFPLIPVTIKIHSNIPNYKTTLINILEQFEIREKKNGNRKMFFN
jgi:hypothetical protein